METNKKGALAATILAALLGSLQLLVGLGDAYESLKTFTGFDKTHDVRSWSISPHRDASGSTGGHDRAQNERTYTRITFSSTGDASGGRTHSPLLRRESHHLE